MYLLFNARTTNGFTYEYNDVKRYSKLTWNYVKEMKQYDCVIYVFCVRIYEWKEHMKYGKEYGAWKTFIYKSLGMRIFTVYFFII